MKWMGGWSCEDFDSAPQSMIDEIKKMIAEEAEMMEDLRNG